MLDVDVLGLVDVLEEAVSWGEVYLVEPAHCVRFSTGIHLFNAS